MEDRYSSDRGKEPPRTPEARYAYYRRCQVFKRNGVQCKGPAETGSQICHAHASQLATAVRRERERRAVLMEAVAEMRKRGRPECEMADLFTDFKGIQVTTAVMARAVITGKIDSKTAGQLVVHLQTISKLLWQIHRKGRKGRKDLPLIHTDATDLKKLPNPKPFLRMNADPGKMPKPKLLPRINADDADWKRFARCADRPSGAGAKVLQFAAMAFGNGSRAHGPPELKAA
ncbi:MAG TPA: hypothetical protein VKV30_08760 [Candidatus Angelobacter sp.]|nr:hypothetical protein [Candidatus Angelobacter sp.]